MVVFNVAWATSRRTCPMYNTKEGWRGGRTWRASVQRDALVLLCCIAETPQEGRLRVGNKNEFLPLTGLHWISSSRNEIRCKL